MRLLLFLAMLLLVWASAESNFPYLGTDTSKARIDLEQILSAGPPPQGIPALGFTGDRNGYLPPTPSGQLVPVAQATGLNPEEPVIVYASKAYPLRILLWHEIINDSLAPLAITFSPSTNSTAVFDRRIAITDTEREAVLKLNPKAKIAALDATYKAMYKAQTAQDAPEWGLEVSFGTSGMLYNANTLIFDSLTSTVFSQLSGRGAVGLLADRSLLRYPSQVVSLAAFAKAYPGGQVFSLSTGFDRNYNQNPYFGYERSGQTALMMGVVDGRVAVKERIVGLELGNQGVAYTYNNLASKRVINDTVGTTDLVVWWAPNTRSVLDAGRIDQAKDVGAVGVFNRKLGSRTLNFVWDKDAWVDQETKSRWNILGQAVAGPMQGQQLEAIAHNSAFWFAWAAFWPNTELKP